MKDDLVLLSQVLGVDENIVGVKNFSVFGETPRGMADNTQAVFASCTTMAVYLVDGTDLPH